MKDQNILVLTYWSYKEGLIQTYTLPYLRIMAQHISRDSKIHLLTFEKDHLRLNDEELSKARKSLTTHKIHWKPVEYRPPGLRTYGSHVLRLISLIRFIQKNRIKTIHCFCSPPGAIGYVLSKLTSARLVLDSCEPHAENMVEVGHWSSSGFKFKLLSWLEKLQVKAADKVILTTHGMYDYIETKYRYTLSKEISYVKPACVDLDLFNLRSEDIKDEIRRKLHIPLNHIVAVYAGKLGGIYYEEEVFELLKRCDDYWKGNFTFLMLTNTDRKVIDAHCALVGLDTSKVLSKFVLHNEIADYISVGDFGLTPVKSVPTKRYCTPIKDGEYWALGLPVIITPNISDDSEIIEKNKIGAVVESFEDKDIDEAIRTIDRLIKSKSIKKTIRGIAQKHRSFDIAHNIYKKIYSEL